MLRLRGFKPFTLHTGRAPWSVFQDGSNPQTLHREARALLSSLTTSAPGLNALFPLRARTTPMTHLSLRETSHPRPLYATPAFSHGGSARHEGHTYSHPCPAVCCALCSATPLHSPIRIGAPGVLPELTSISSTGGTLTRLDQDGHARTGPGIGFTDRGLTVS